MFPASVGMNRRRHRVSRNIRRVPRVCGDEPGERGAVHDCDVNAAKNLQEYAVSYTVFACGGEGAGSRCKPTVKPVPVKQEFNAMTTFS